VQINAINLPVQAWSKEKAGINKRLELNHQKDAYLIHIELLRTCYIIISSILVGIG